LRGIVAHGSFDLHPRSDDWAIAELETPVDTGQYGMMSVISAARLRSLEEPAPMLGGGLLSHIGYAALHPSMGGSPVLVSGCSERRYISQEVIDQAERNLQVLWVDRATMFAHDCSATGGQSGVPIFLMQDGQAQLVGIQTMEDVPKEYVSTVGSEAIRLQAFDFVSMNYAVSVEQFGPAVQRLSASVRTAIRTSARASSWAAVKSRN
jgi:hypothetical protein